MPYEGLYVSINGLTSKEVADYATKVKCPNGHAISGKLCHTNGRPVCTDRFTVAVKQLSAIAGTAVKTELSPIPEIKLHGTGLRSQTLTRAELQSRIAANVAKLYDQGDLTTHSTGITYICLVNRGQAKIGYSKDLYRRLRDISRDHGSKVTVLATLPGGYTREMCVQHQFRDSRVPVTGELFTVTPELLSFSAKSGFYPESRKDLTRFNNWVLPGK